MILTLQPVGRVETRIIERIGSDLAVFGEVRMATPKELPRRAFGRKRYPAATFHRFCNSSDGDRVIAITDGELSDPDLGLDLVFGHADLRGRWGVVSLAEFGGDGDDKLVERAVKTAVHELGHTLGLSHHDANPDCVMFFSQTLADTDRKGRDFCRECAPTANLTLSLLQT